MSNLAPHLVFADEIASRVPAILVLLRANMAAPARPAGPRGAAAVAAVGPADEPAGEEDHLQDHHDEQ